MALNDIKVPKENAQGTFDEIALAASDLKLGTTANLPLRTGTSGVIEAGSFGTAAGSFCEGNDARLSDARTPSSTLAHKASHATGGTDALAPSDIGAQSLFTSSNETVSADVTLSSARAARVRLESYSGATYNVTLPTTDVRVGDVFIFTTGTLVGAQTIRRENFGGNFTTLATISEGQSYRIISIGTASGSWQIDPVFTHTHVVADVTGAAASGSITASGLTQATARILGRTTASTGAVEELAASDVRSFLNVADGAEVNVNADWNASSGDAQILNKPTLAASATTDTTNASNISSGTLATARMGSGTPSASNYLRGDGSWQTVTAGVGGGTGATDNAIIRADGTGGSTVQSSDINIEDATTTTANNVTISNQHSGQTNSSLVLTPKGTGAFIVGPRPDGAATGGNARGTMAVDLQLSRSAATHVANGNNSFLAGGILNRASGANAGVICGFSCSATGNSGVVISGFNNTASGSEYSIVAGGRDSTASGQQAGVYNCNSGNATQANTIVLGGANNTASGTNAAVLGGSQNTASSTSASAFGERALADRLRLQAHASGMFAATGDAQRTRAVLRCKTTTNAAVEMALDGSTTYLTIPSGKVIFCNIKVVGVKSDGAVVATYERQYAAKNVAGTSSEVFAPVTIGTDNASSTSLEVATVDAGDYIRIRPTGITSETWRWVASVDAVEVAYGA
jgi:hypothetical protein